MNEKVKNIFADIPLRIGTVLTGLVILDFGVALSVVTNVGMGTYDGMVTTLADVLHINIGTFSIIFNFLLITAQIVLEGKHFQKSQLLQYPNVFLSGTILNFLIYTVFKNVTFGGYVVRLAISCLSNVARALGVMLILESNFVRAAMEGLVQIVCDRKHWRLGRIMQLLDAVYIAVSLIMTSLFHTPYRVREGTVAAMLLFGPLLELFRKPIRKLKAKYGVLA